MAGTGVALAAWKSHRYRDIRREKAVLKMANGVLQETLAGQI